MLPRQSSHKLSKSHLSVSKGRTILFSPMSLSLQVAKVLRETSKIKPYLMNFAIMLFIEHCQLTILFVLVKIHLLLQLILIVKVMKNPLIM